MNIALIKVIWVNRKLYFKTALVAFVFALITAFLIPSEFKSVAILYPAFPTKLENNNDESKTERLMQYILSNDVKNILLRKFDLATHYQLDKKDPKFDAYFSNCFLKNFKKFQTRFESIQIEVYDRDPVMAQKLASGYIDAINEHIKKVFYTDGYQKIKQLEYNLSSKQKKIDSLSLIIKQVGKENGILDYFIQVEQFSRSYYKNVATNNTSNFYPEFQKLNKNGSEFMVTLEHLKNITLACDEIRNEIDEEKAIINSDLSFLNVVSQPNLPSEKSFPNRMVIFLSIFLSINVLVVFFIITRNKLQKIKDEIIE